MNNSYMRHGVVGTQKKTTNPVENVRLCKITIVETTLEIPKTLI